MMNLLSVVTVFVLVPVFVCYAVYNVLEYYNMIQSCKALFFFTHFNGGKLYEKN